MFITALRALFNDLRHDLRPQPPRNAVPLDELNKVCGLLLRNCRGKDTARSARAKTALKHASAARTLAELGYPAGVVNYIAHQAIAAAQG